jgi:ubiquinone/menaquinone biosynthesis C-methylase UbiE
VEDGIPRFVAPDYYWGEHRRVNATALLDEAEQRGWREASEARFADDRNFLLSVLDWQRAAWLPIVGLDRDAVALDVGCGHGAITESLARTLGEVYAVDAIPERIAFTALRLRQEALSNVRIVQASALRLPFPDKLFDLIVVNGVLEWVGEWDLEGTPRAVQLGFLRGLRRLLKEDGILVIGIENRYGYSAFLGAGDHSGLAYTSLMPRFMATACLKLNRRPHHRTTLNARRQYRTYTYGQSGYRRLLAAAGFGQTRFYWSDPGYNEPYHLIPLQRHSILEHLRAMRMEPTDALRASGWRHRVKRLFGSSLRFFAPEFVIFARQGRERTGLTDDPLARRLRDVIPAIGRVKNPVTTVSTYPFSQRSVIHVVESGMARPHVILKASTPTDTSPDIIQSEARNLVAVAARVRELSAPLFAVPEPLGAVHVGTCLYAAQAPARGEQLHRLVLRQSRRHRFETLRAALRRSIDAAGQISSLFSGQDVGRPDTAWLHIPPSFESAPGLGEVVQRLQSLGQRGDTVQHGDFTIENVFFECEGGALTVIDWECLTRGFPVLYDVFSLLFSAVPLVGMEAKFVRSRHHSLDAQFVSAFFSTGPWPRMFGELLRQASALMTVEPAQLWDQFIGFLLARHTVFTRRNSHIAARAHASFLVYALRYPERFLIEMRHGSPTA